MIRYLFFLRSIIIFILLLASIKINANPIDDIWNALEKNDKKLARELLEKTIKDPQYKVDASLILMLLNSLEDNKVNMSIMESIFPDLSDPSPYLYSYWFTDAVTDGYSKKKDTQLKFLKTILSSTKVNESIKGSVHYVLGMHYLYSNDLKKSELEWKQIGSITNWQLVGPFDNTSGSGFDKIYKPITNPEPQAKFKSKTNADILWFIPKYLKYDPWLMSMNYIPESQAVIYAQTFVNSPVDKDVMIALGGFASLKLWVNDQLVIQQEDERQTDMDVYKKSITLQKGDNRILVQVGFTEKTTYPNFIVRLLDLDGMLIKDLTYSNEFKSYKKVTEKNNSEVKIHFAEDYFEKKIIADPKNLLNYLLLSKAYFRRQYSNKAIEILKKAQKIYPNNILVNYELLLNYYNIGDRTEILKQVDHIRNIDPEFLFLAAYDFENDYKNENYSEVEKDLKKIKKAVGEDSESYLSFLIRYQYAKKDYNVLYETIEKAYKKYPENADFLKTYSEVVKSTSSSSDQAMQLLEKYLASNYNSSIFDALIEDYQNMNNNEKVEKNLLKYNKMFPDETSYLDKLISFYYNAKEYKKALEIVNIWLENSPYYYQLWYNKGYIDYALNNIESAINDFQKSLQYNPNLFDARERIREMQNKAPILNYFRDTLVYETINSGLENLKKTDDNYQYIFNKTNFAVFPEGASVEYSSFAIKMQNVSGVKYWKNIYIPYNSYRQKLIIEKAEVIKKNGQKVQAEENNNEMVFPSLEENDVIYVAYRIENYTGGILCKEFWQDHTFNAIVPMQVSTFKLLTPKGYSFNIDTTNLSQKPVVSNLDDFDMYDWTFNNLLKCKDEDYMPPVSELGTVLNISTIKSWKTIADWYRDIAIPQAKEDYNVLLAYDEIFKDTIFNSDFDKAKAIYDYICDNINYSSVSFLQSNYTPQKPMVTLSTQLGDCKDLSTLYYTLAKKAGLKTHLVLVNTRDNGENNIKNPSVNFNHVIVKIDIGDKTIYQELTYKKLKFGTLPNKVINSQALVIPVSVDDSVGTRLIHIPSANLIKNEIERRTYLSVVDNNLSVNTTLNVSGSSAERYKDDYSGSTYEQMKETLKSSISKNFENNLQLDTFNISNLENRDSSFIQYCSFKLKGEVKIIGVLNVIKPPFFDKIFTTDVFTKDDRIYPIVYWKYEPINSYKNTIILELPKGVKLEELPKNTMILNKFIDYKLTIEKLQDNKISISRIVKINNETLPPSEYNEFKKTRDLILKAEDIYFGYK